MFDTHCHLDSPRFDGDRDEVLGRARQAGVRDILIPSIGPDGWEPLLEWAAGKQGIHVALGIHPQLIPELSAAEDDRHLARLDELLAGGVAVAVGECGLDAPTAARAGLDRQTRILRAHLDLARKHRLPALVHCLRAHEPLMALLGETGGPQLVLHSYSGSAEQARQLSRFDPYFSFAGPVTYPNARRPLSAARAVPRTRLLAETDAPDQTPRPHQGRCEPAQLAEVVGGLAAALGTSFAEMARLTDENARRALGLAPSQEAPP